MRKYLIIFLSVFLFYGCNKIGENPTDAGWDSSNTDKNNQLSVMSYNIRHCAPYYGTSETTSPDVEATAAVIKSKKADVVFLQEVDKSTTRSLGIDQPQKLAQLSGYPYYAFFKIMDYREGEYGLSIMSKYALNDSQTYLFPDAIEGYTLQYKNAVGTATIRIDGTDILLMVVHLSVEQADRIVQLPYLLNTILKNQSKPILMVGDFNATPVNVTIQELVAAGYARTNTDPSKFTIPSNAPNRELDHITYYPMSKFKVISHHVFTGINASDHLPIMAVLELNK